MNIFSYLRSNPIVLILIIILISLLTFTAINEFRKAPSTPPLAEVEIVNSFESAINSVSITPGTVSISSAFNLTGDYKEEAPILTYSQVDLDDNFVNSTNEKFGVDKAERETIEGTGEVSSTRNGTKTLDIYKKWGVLIYTDRQTFTPNTDYSFEENADVYSYQKKAETFVKTVGIDLSHYKLVLTQYLNYPSDEPEPLTNLSAAGLIEFTYMAQNDDIPIIDGVSVLTPETVTVSIDKDSVVRKINASLVGTPGKATANLRMKTLDELKESVQRGEATLIDSSFGPNVKILYTQVEGATLMYYASGDRLIPVYVLNARLTSETGATGTGKLIIKAF